MVASAFFGAKLEGVGAVDENAGGMAGSAGVVAPEPCALDDEPKAEGGACSPSAFFGAKLKGAGDAGFAASSSSVVFFGAKLKPVDLLDSVDGEDAAGEPVSSAFFCGAKLKAD